MKISFVIPVHNCEDHLRNAVASIQFQDFADWEAVVVDDGSTDSTPVLADALAGEDHRIRVVHQANGGVSVARNRGMDEARGDWIAWLDADDAYIPGALRRMAELADANQDCQCLQFPYQEIQSDGSTKPRIPPAYSSHGGRSFSGQEAFDILFARDGAESMNWQPWRFVYRRDSLPRFRVGKIHEDVDVLPLHLAGLARVFIAKDTLYAYRPARAGAVTETFTPRRVRDILDVTDNVYSQLAKSGLPDNVKRGFASTLACNLFGFYLATPGFDEPDRSELLAAFAAHPEWLRAIAWPPRTAWLKRLLLNIIGIRLTAVLVNRLTSGRGLHSGSKS
jgi:glycosyltransferase involved in cell wall biosynthesis